MQEDQIPEDERNDDLPELDIRQENAFKKMKMNLELGTVFPDQLSKDLPPEIEGAFLDSIINFEKAFRNSERITINQKLKKPHFIPENVLNDTEIDFEIEKVFELLVKNNIRFETLAQDQYNNREIYKFLTEDFLEQEVDDIDVPNMISFFTYEDFRPNHKYILQKDANNFIESFFKNDKKSFDDITFDKKAVGKKIQAAKKQFTRLKLIELQQKHITFNAKKATLIFDIAFEGYTGLSQKFNFSGDLVINYKFDAGYWYISDAQFPFDSNPFYKK
ncbi:MAG: hypothetical protein RLZZ312_1758 [Bacteroidota bacterium]|jgi:hypothetical protein